MSGTTEDTEGTEIKKPAVPFPWDWCALVAIVALVAFEQTTGKKIPGTSAGALVLAGLLGWLVAQLIRLHRQRQT